MQGAGEDSQAEVKCKSGFIAFITSASACSGLKRLDLLVNGQLRRSRAVSAWPIFVFFIRFWRKTRDRLFVFFAAAFLPLGVERLAILITSAELHSYCYLIRLAAFLLIIFAILDKNRRGGI